MHSLKSIAVLVIASLSISGCLSAPEIYPPGKAPSYVREIKYIRIFGYDTRKQFGLELAKEDMVTVMARGAISRGPSNIYGVERIMTWIGDNFMGSLLWGVDGATFKSPHSGQLSMGIIDTYPRGLSGHFDITIIVWNTRDYYKIADFLEQLHRNSPDHEGVAEALRQTKWQIMIEDEKKKTSEEISATKGKIEELQKESEKQTGLLSPDNRQRVQDLETRLLELAAKVAELDELSRQLQQARGTTAALTRQLDELERRERELIGKGGRPAASLPIILISSPDDNERSFTDSLRLTGAAEDGNGLKKLEVYLNGSLIPQAESGTPDYTNGNHPTRLTFDRHLTLENGPNQIQVVATGLIGLSAEKQLTVHYTPRSRNVWAVVIGINDYPKLPKLKYAVNDAQAFFDLLAIGNQVPAANITLLVNDQATLRNLRSALGIRLKEAADKDDMVIIYFAGHGAVEPDTKSLDADGLEKYLLTYDSDPSELYATGFPMREIAHILDRIRSERLIFVADSCYSGASGGRTVSTGGIRANISDTFLDRIAGGRGKVIITASAANEVSVEKDDLQHGVFTYYLLEGLKGAADSDRDGMITVDEAYRYVSEKVPRATGQEQHPVKKGSVEGNLILSINRQ